MITSTLHSTFRAAQKHSETLRSFTFEMLPLAGVQHMVDLARDTVLDGSLSEAQHAELARLVGKLEVRFAAPSRRVADGCQYLIYSDGSLLFRSSGGDEVWADAADFIADRLRAATPEAWDSQERELVGHVEGNI